MDGTYFKSLTAKSESDCWSACENESSLANICLAISFNSLYSINCYLYDVVFSYKQSIGWTTYSLIQIDASKTPVITTTTTKTITGGINLFLNNFQ